METNFRQLVAEQRDERVVYSRTGWVPREQEKALNIQSKMAQIITGVRRSGKSTLAHRALAGVNYAYVNFDDERFAGVEPKDLDHLLEALYDVYGEFTHLLLDEIQNVSHWELFVNRLLRNELHVVLTGSNSKLLARELATHLTGRYSIIELLPFSFKEFLHVRGVITTAVVTAKEKGLISRLFAEYMQTGGFPDIIMGETPASYIQNLFEAIVTRDIIFRHKIRQIRAFRETASFLTENYSAPVSYNRLKNIFSLGSENTSKNYVAYLEEAWLLLSLSKFSFKNQERMRNRKIYLVDTAFAKATGGIFSPNTGRLLENIVFLELFRRSRKSRYELFYHKSNYEVDFVIYSNSKVQELIQVAVSVSNDAVLRREVRALISAARELGTTLLTIITQDERDEVVKNGFTIRILPVWEWLLNVEII